MCIKELNSILISFGMLAKPNALFRLASRLTIGMVGIISRIVIGNGKGNIPNSFILLASFWRHLTAQLSNLILYVLHTIYFHFCYVCFIFALCNKIYYLSWLIINYSIVVLLNKTRIHNKHRLEDLVENRPQNSPLLTISNHYSCFDDPGDNLSIYVNKIHTWN